MSMKKIVVILFIIFIVGSFFQFDLAHYFTLEYIRSAHSDFEQFYQINPVLTVSVFFTVYLLMAAFSLPGAAVMTLLAGALFGVAIGTLLVSFASTLGASVAFLAARYLAGDYVQEKFASRMKSINKGMKKDGAFYLFTLRLVPIFPFFVINLLMGLTTIRLWTFYWVSQVGMLAGTIVYVNAGTQLASVESIGDLLSAELLGAFALLGIFPWLAKGMLGYIQRRRVYASWRRPASFDRNVIVIGAGSAGLVTAYISAAVKASVTLIEKNKMGGDCLNTGCVPSKALIRSASVAHESGHFADYGLKGAPATVDFSAVMDRVHRVINRIEAHDSVERYTSLGVDCINGAAKVISPWEVEITSPAGEKRVLSARHIVVATGARPFVPPIPGIENIHYLTSDNLWELKELPKRLVVLGGGPIGCELSQTFARLGSQVSQVEMNDRIMVREDEDASALVSESLRRDGVELLVRHKAVRFQSRDGQSFLVVECDGDEKEIPFDAVLVAVGRRANTEGLGLEDLGIERTQSGTIVTNEYLQTAMPNILACGDVAGPYQFTHTAAHQAWYASVNSLFGNLKKFAVDYSVIPWATFTAPEVARVGLNEQDATDHGISYEVTRYGIDDLDRAIADGSDHGFVKVLTEPGRDRILGVTIAGKNAGDLIAEYVLAMRHNIGLNKILGTIHIYPTMAEANKYAAGEWKRAHAPERILSLLRRYHAWRRGVSAS